MEFIFFTLFSIAVSTISGFILLSGSVTPSSLATSYNNHLHPSMAWGNYTLIIAIRRDSAPFKLQISVPQFHVHVNHNLYLNSFNQSQPIQCAHLVFPKRKSSNIETSLIICRTTCFLPLPVAPWAPWAWPSFALPAFPALPPFLFFVDPQLLPAAPQPPWRLKPRDTPWEIEISFIVRSD